MKTVSMIVVGLLIATVAIGDGTNEFATLQKAYEASVKQAVAPVTKAYLQKLDTLKKKLGASGDLANAQIVQKEIERLSSTDSQTPVVQVISAKFGVDKRWLNVTKLVSQMCDEEGTTFAVKDVTKGLPDLAYMVHKTLIVIYYYNGKKMKKSFIDDSTAVLDDRSEQ